MIINENVWEDHGGEDHVYNILVSTDSSVERDIIKKYLFQAQEEYWAWLKYQTKPIPEAKVAYAVRVDDVNNFQKSKEKYSSIFCKCDMLIFFEAPRNGWYKVTCPNPNCGHCQKVLVNKGETDE